MKRISLKVVLVISLIVALSACEKDDTPGVGGSPLIGTFVFGSFENVVIRKWVAGGVEVTPTNLEKEAIFENNIPNREGLSFNFKYNYDLIGTNSITGESDTIKFKLSNGLIYVSLLDSPKRNEDYFPFLVYSNNNLYYYYSYFEYKSNGGLHGMGTLHLQPEYNILDTGFKYTFQIGSVNQLKTGEEILTAQFKANFVKK